MRQGKSRQRGFSIFGFILGLVVGLGVALVVAVYVTKVPVPFIDRGVMTSAEQDHAESDRNKDWNPNANFNQNKSAVTMGDAVGAEQAPHDALNALVKLHSEERAAAPTEPSAITPSSPALREDSVPTDATITPENAEAIASAPVLPTASIGQVRELLFFVQAGAYNRLQDAESQRAKLAILGIDARVTTETLNGQQVNRVRAGPFKTRSAALSTRQRLTEQNVESLIVVVPK